MILQQHPTYAYQKMHFKNIIHSISPISHLTLTSHISFPSLPLFSPSHPTWFIPSLLLLLFSSLPFCLAVDLDWAALAFDRQDIEMVDKDGFSLEFGFGLVFTHALFIYWFQTLLWTLVWIWF